MIQTRIILRYIALGILTYALTACAPSVQRLGPVSYEPQILVAAFQMADGTSLPFRIWPADAEERAVIVAVHGFNDYSAAFAEAGSFWGKHGITTIAYDQRGFGQASRPGIWASDETLASDLLSVLALTRAAHPKVPVIVLGVSMGSAVAIHAFSESEHSDLLPDGIILASPAVWHGGPMSPLYRIALWLGAHTLPGKTATGRSLDRQASDNIEMLRALGRDPLVIKETRIDTVYGLVGLMHGAYRIARAMPTPVLALYGAKDEIVPLASLQGIEETLPQHDAIWYPEGYHMLLRDLQAETVWQDVSDWIFRDQP